MQFSKAQRKRAKLRLALAGPAGSGKTWGALEIAKGLGGKVAVIDTERGSASLYSDRAEFDTLELNPPYTPERCIEAIHAAEAGGFDVVIFDSITHEWNGSGGCLEINDTSAQARYKGNTWAAWNETTPRHRAFLDAILQSPLHFIATLRSKTETVQEGGKVRKVGMKPETREGGEYEFTVVLEIEHDRHLAVATKDRTRLFKEPHVITPETGKRLLAWLESGAVVVSPVQQHAKAIEDAETLDELKAAWLERSKDTRLTHDESVALQKLKDERKAALAPATVPAASPTPAPAPVPVQNGKPAEAPAREAGIDPPEANGSPSPDEVAWMLARDQALDAMKSARFPLTEVIRDSQKIFGRTLPGKTLVKDLSVEDLRKLKAHCDGLVKGRRVTAA